MKLISLLLWLCLLEFGKVPCMNYLSLAEIADQEATDSSNESFCPKMSCDLELQCLSGTAFVVSQIYRRWPFDWTPVKGIAK